MKFAGILCMSVSAVMNQHLSSILTGQTPEHKLPDASFVTCLVTYTDGFARTGHSCVRSGCWGDMRTLS